jgi:hypothetical protein
MYAESNPPTRPIPEGEKKEAARLPTFVIAPPFPFPVVEGPVVEGAGDGRTAVGLEAGGLASGGANGEPAVVH